MQIGNKPVENREPQNDAFVRNLLDLEEKLDGSTNSDMSRTPWTSMGDMVDGDDAVRPRKYMSNPAAQMTTLHTNKQISLADIQVIRFGALSIDPAHLHNPRLAFHPTRFPCRKGLSVKEHDDMIE
ncbi:unnamed protein product [Echinostoma caproni]|uniref:Uncharacterized protein n=1 Tax=Echinostoma caproni TaxID=27848 RepID=A0A183AJ46_9TREM|nr:unnamed protein product [Echinostoma caproni]